MALTTTQLLPSLSLAGNAMRIAISSNNVIDSLTGNRRPFYNIFLQVYNGATLLFEDSIEPDTNGVSTFNISPVVSAAIKATLTYPMSAFVVEDSGAVAVLTFKMAEGYGIPFVKGAFQDIAGSTLAIPGGCADWYLKQLEEANSDFGTQLFASNQFLTSQPQQRTVLPASFIILRAITGINGGTISLKAIKTIADGTISTVTLWSGTLEAYKLYDFNVSPSKLSDAVSYSVWLHNNESNKAITPVHTFVVSQTSALQQRNIIFRNSLGGWDTACATGKFITEMELQRTTFNNPVISRFRDTLEPGADRAMGIRFMKGSIGFLNNEELEWLQEMGMSEEVYMVTERGLEKIVVKVDRWIIADDDLAPKTIAIEAIVGNSDFFFHD